MEMLFLFVPSLYDKVGPGEESDNFSPRDISLLIPTLCYTLSIALLTTECPVTSPSKFCANVQTHVNSKNLEGAQHLAFILQDS